LQYQIQQGALNPPKKTRHPDQPKPTDSATGKTTDKATSNDPSGSAGATPSYSGIILVIFAVGGFGWKIGRDLECKG
jgi:hypothetical protein